MAKEGMNVLRIFETIKGKYTDPYIKENAEEQKQTREQRTHYKEKIL